ncbi:WG repeat-containing protein [Micromonospora yangpuensis]|nr:WG repeat-containing protein [Micromonospora yangpuensis]GGL97207.1 hypothetical protein GCM10012279_13400 [Micromonospora yangpuensis]
MAENVGDAGRTTVAAGSGTFGSAPSDGTAGDPPATTPADVSAALALDAVPGPEVEPAPTVRPADGPAGTPSAEAWFRSNRQGRRDEDPPGQVSGPPAVADAPSAARWTELAPTAGMSRAHAAAEEAAGDREAVDSGETAGHREAVDSGATTAAGVAPTADDPVSAPAADRPGSGAEGVDDRPRGDAQPSGERPTAEPAGERGGQAAGLLDEDHAADAPVDPEQALAGLRWRLDPRTLREVVTDPDELRTIRRRLTEKLDTAVDNRTRTRLLSLRAVASRLLGELDDALDDGRLALTYAEATGELRRTALVQARLAQVLRWRREFGEADRLFAEAASPELPARLRAAMHEHAGRSCYDQGRLMEACHHFEQALDLRGDGDAELSGRIGVALDAVRDRAAEGGFGPYPRDRHEILERPRPPVPAPDADHERWGYVDPDGEFVIAPDYAMAQPYHEEVAWVRRPGSAGWTLLDRGGVPVLETSWQAVRPFAGGRAWVSPDGSGSWLGIDPSGEVVVPHGFDQVYPFRAGLAVVRRGPGWGAVDATGQFVVPTRYDGFSTQCSDGRQVDGFTDEGLAVVVRGGLRGVVDRAGRLVVAPAHPVLLIHPVAFLVGDGVSRWGALDRRGARLIDPVHRDRGAVSAEIERLLTDTSPVL